MNIKFSHVNIISSNWKKLAEFYISVFCCEPLFPERDLSGNWLDKLTNLQNAGIRGIHLRLPGYPENGPTLEIFEYNRNLENSQKQINLEGFGHIAFSVENVEEILNLLLEKGGSTVGKRVNARIPDVGTIDIVYARDPEGNIVELQKWF